MKYFTSDLWRKLSSASSEERNSAYKEWECAIQLYNKELACVLRRATKEEYKAINLCKGLHDCPIKKMEFIQNKKNRKWRIEITLELDDSKCVRIVFEDVIAFDSNIKIGMNCILGDMGWGYDEFSIGDKSRLHFALLCDLYNEINIDFHSIKAIHCNLKPSRKCRFFRLFQS